MFARVLLKERFTLLLDMLMELSHPVSPTLHLIMILEELAVHHSH